MTTKLCRNKLHPMTEANPIQHASASYRRCLTCFAAKQRRGHPNKTAEGTCHRGLHRMEGANVITDAATGRLRCRACTLARVARRRRDGEVVQVQCLSKGCRGATWRSAYTPDRPYVCPRHRAKPNLSVLTALKIRGINPRSLGIAA